MNQIGHLHYKVMVDMGIDDTLIVDSILINGGQLIVGKLELSYFELIEISSSVNVLLPNEAGSIGPRVIGALGGWS
ncbi:unnamed protein product [Rotaria magnacalcarata]|uniref:Uncharacterized protein n=1 Tax=Rotaria magnacalcarata TaxID=392030 RepID=A0A8S2LVY5_9BILA|nr:unnamed protein product [Rotaria magnacalcarata]CAF3924647.1 unnamed protein product [Rotaria magnacalcarata]CAF4583399.1 unnamed protein product [Rotaria magnacalcarata]